MNNTAGSNINQARSLIDNAKSILIATHIRPTLDSVAASLSLYLSLSALGKQVSIVCPSAMTVEYSHLVGVDKITNELAKSFGKNLVISFPYQEGSIEKVSYNIENDTFNLVIEPREGFPQITQDAINYSYGNGDTDLIIVIDTPRLPDLDQIYQNNQSLFNAKNIINIDSHNQNTNYGRVNNVNPIASSTSEIVLSFLSEMGYKIDPDTASNLLIGLSSGSANFTSVKTSAATFEAAAICLRNGAKKQDGQKTFSDMTEQFGQSQFGNQPKFMPNLPKMKPSTPFSGREINPSPLKTGPVNASPNQNNNPPPDWLKPKIYKGSGGLL